MLRSMDDVDTFVRDVLKAGFAKGGPEVEHALLGAPPAGAISSSLLAAGCVARWLCAGAGPAESGDLCDEPYARHRRSGFGLTSNRVGGAKAGVLRQEVLQAGQTVGPAPCSSDLVQAIRLCCNFSACHRGEPGAASLQTLCCFAVIMPFTECISISHPPMHAQEAERPIYSNTLLAPPACAALAALADSLDYLAEQLRQVWVVSSLALVAQRVHEQGRQAQTCMQDVMQVKGTLLPWRQLYVWAIGPA